jgi:glycerol-3-phosphate responsive antiterminator
VQFEKDDSQAQKRIPMLNGELKKLKDILADAQAKNQNVVIHSDISISLVDKK